jgi:hypothetical protein
MPTWAKVIFTIIVIGAVGMVIVGVVAYRWVSGRKGQFEATMKAGRSFGLGKSDSACVDEALRRTGRGGLVATVDGRMFVQGCFAVAGPSAGLCQGVPPRSQIMAFARWAASDCQRRGAVDQSSCTQVMQEVAEHCAGSSSQTGHFR